MIPTPAQLASDLVTADQATIVSLAGLDVLSCPEVSMCQTWGGGKLIFSDSPEKPTTRGRLYEDATLAATEGTNYNRLFVYHVNGYGGSSKMKFSIILKNLGSVSGTFTRQKGGVAGPTTSYLYAGKLAFQRYLQSTPLSPTNLLPGQSMRIATDFELQASPNYLMHIIMDYSFTQPHQITVAALNPTDDPLTVAPTLPILTRDANHQRGTFPYSDKVYDTATGAQIDTADGCQQFPLAGGTVNDDNAVGVDATDLSSMTLAGNYGVLYRIHLNTKSSDAKNLACLINPRGGAWGGAQWALTGITAGGKILVPDSTGSTGDNTKGVVSGKWAPGTSLTIWNQFLPTGGAALPLRFVLAPY